MILINFTLGFSINNNTVTIKIYNRLNYLNFELVNISFLDVNVQRRSSYGVHIFKTHKYATIYSKTCYFNSLSLVSFCDKPIKDGKH